MPEQCAKGVNALEQLEEHFANFFEVGFTKTLIVLDFSQADSERSGRPAPKMRVTVQPQDAVILADLLRIVIRQYSERFPESGVAVD